jgi:leader peptidase (prepilin peptidase) / N-methyltransferase
MTAYNQAKSLLFRLRATGFWRQLEILISGIIFAFGLIFGSFLNVCIYRLPRGLSVVRPGSACPHCAKAIPFYDNVPVFSWLILGGRCRSCSSRISPRYLIVELLTAGVFLLCYSNFGLSLATLKCAIFGFLLLGLIFTDAETHLLPDKLTLTGLAIGLIFSWFVPVNDLLSILLPGSLLIHVSPNISSRLFSMMDSALGAVVGASFLYGAGAIYLRARGVEGMGFGDVKLMAMIGSFVGLRLTILTIFAASLAGSAFGLSTVLTVWFKRTHRRKRAFHEADSVARKRAWGSALVALRRYQMPFGVFLGSMGLGAFLFGQRILHWYWG